MFIKNREGKLELIALDRITAHLRKLAADLNVDPDVIAIKTVQALSDGITPSKLNEISAEIAYDMIIEHYDYAVLAVRIIVTDLHKSVSASFTESLRAIANTGRLDTKYLDFALANKERLDNIAIHENDHLYEYVALRLIKKTYLQYDTVGDEVIYYERPQHILMRVALAASYVNGTCDIEKVFSDFERFYYFLSEQYITLGTPALLNACMKSQQLGSCFLLGVNDNTKDIMKTVKNCALISKFSGGIGIHYSNIRASGAIIKSSGRPSSGICPQLAIFDSVGECFNQGGKRAGRIAIYLEDWHADLERFLMLKRLNNTDSCKASNLFYGLWLSDLFIKRAQAKTKEGQQYSLFSSDTAPGLNMVYDGMPVCSQCGWCDNPEYREVFGLHCRDTPLYDRRVDPNVNENTNCAHTFVYENSYTKLYTYYENSGRAVRVVNAKHIIDEIIKLKRETGGPYICHKDSVNRCSMQKSMGTIKSSNLCAEIVQLSSQFDYASCILGSINVKKLLLNGVVRYKLAVTCAQVLTEILDRVIDINKYPVKECIDHAQAYRSIGIGQQGLANLFAALELPFNSPEAAEIDLKISESIYYGFVTKSNELAREKGAFRDCHLSPIGRGEFHFELWRKNQEHINSRLKGSKVLSGLYDWDTLREQVKEYGVRNAHGCAHMPTVSTSILLSNNDSFEPFAQNIGTISTGCGQFIVIYKELFDVLHKRGLWNKKNVKNIINNRGMLSKIPELDSVAPIFETVWEIKQRVLLERAALRGAFVDQSQSMNIFLEQATDQNIRSAIVYANEIGLKTGSYYMRMRAAADAMKNNLVEESPKIKEEEVVDEEQNVGPVCTREAGCVSCAL